MREYTQQIYDQNVRENKLKEEMKKREQQYAQAIEALRTANTNQGGVIP